MTFLYYSLTSNSALVHSQEVNSVVCTALQPSLHVNLLHSQWAISMVTEGLGAILNCQTCIPACHTWPGSLSCLSYNVQEPSFGCYTRSKSISWSEPLSIVIRGPGTILVDILGPRASIICCTWAENQVWLSSMAQEPFLFVVHGLGSIVDHHVCPSCSQL